MKLWQIYVWALSGMLIFSAVGRVLLFVKKRELVTRLDLFEAAAGLVVIPALFGFAYERAYGNRLLWATMCVVLVTLSVYQFFTPKMRKIYDKGLPFAVGVIAVQTILGGPGLWAIIYYAFFDRQVWG